MSLFDRSFVKQFFNFPQAIFFSFIIVGSLFLIFAAQNDDNFYGKIFSGIGSAILAGGVFSAILKSRLFTDTFLDAVEKVVMGREFLSKRRDLEPIWKNITELISERKFPSIKNKIDQRVLNKFLTKPRDYFYKEWKKDFIIESFDEDRNLIFCKQFTRLCIMPHQDAKSITYIYRYTATFGGNAEFEEFTIDGKNINEYDMKKISEEVSQNRLETTYKFEVPLLPVSHIIERQKRTAIAMGGEPWVITRMQTYAKKTEVTATSHVHGFHLRFISLGDKKAFGDQRRAAVNTPAVSKINTRLLMPGEGYILAVVRGGGHAGVS